MENKHDGYITTPFLGDGFGAGCSCGWEGPLRETTSAAERDLAKHYEETGE